MTPDQPTDGATVAVAVRATARVGEGPVWDADAGRLHWVDILGGAVHSSDLASAQTTTVVVPTMVGAAVPRRGGDGFAAATADGFAVIDRETLDVRCPILADGLRMNDAKCDARGRLWAGSTAIEFEAGAGALHALEPDWTTRVVLDGLTLPNGLGWSPDGKTFYLVDTLAGTLQAFAFDLGAGELSAPRIIRRFDPDDGMPDGLSIDTHGRLWLAMWGGSRLVCLAPSGEELTTLTLPVRQPSSCAFVGSRLSRLAVTSAREGLDGLTSESIDGSVLVVDGLDATGLAVNFFAG